MRGRIRKTDAKETIEVQLPQSIGRLLFSEQDRYYQNQSTRLRKSLLRIRRNLHHSLDHDRARAASSEMQYRPLERSNIPEWIKARGDFHHLSEHLKQQSFMKVPNAAQKQ
jgi:uncharacterized protein (DUF2267 family)